MFGLEDELQEEVKMLREEIIRLREERILLEGRILQFRQEMYKSLEDGDNRTTGDWLNDYDSHFSIKVTREGNI